MRVVAIVAVAGLTLAACQPTAETPEQAQARIDTESAAAKRAIDSTNAEFVKHLGMGHADVLAGFYTEQAHAMPPNGPAAVGREAIKSLWGGFIAMKAGGKITAQSVVANGPVAIERGAYTLTFTPPGAKEPMTDTGKYLVHWHNVGGKWMLADDIWNSDMPAAPPPAPPPAPGKKKR